MIIKYNLEPNTTTNYVTHNGPNLTLFILAGQCQIETVYNGTNINVEKKSHEKYIIEEKVEYRLKNTCNDQCVLVIMSELSEEDIKQTCENYITWGSNHIKPDTHYNFNNGTKKSLSAAA